MPRPIQRRAVRGLTLVELLVVTCLVAVLAALLFPVLSATRRRAAQASCTSQLRQIGQAMSMYLADYEGGHPSYVHRLYPRYITDSRLFACGADVDLDAGGWGTKCHRANFMAWDWDVPAFPQSYGDFGMALDRRDWRKLQKAEGRSGYLVCVTHGTVWRRNALLTFYNGLVLRLCFDGSVASVQVTGAPYSLDAKRLLTDAR